jgi:Ca2+-binding EF-hand superfamily protein
MKKAEKASAHFAVCLDNDGYTASLEVGKLYRFIPDKEAEAEGLIRVIDESGEDYAFSADRFHPIDLPATVEKALLAASHI